jgi:hypothetical protein
MGSFDIVRGRDDDGRFTRTVIDTERTSYEKHTQSAATGDESGEAPPPVYQSQAPSGSETSFGINGMDDDVKEAERNPEHVTAQAGLGQQKVEAAALVWSRPVVFAIYAW